MTTTPGERLLASLPPLFQERDATGDLAALLGAFQSLFFDGSGEAAGATLPGIERSLQAIPTLFAPLGTANSADASTPEPFVRWLAEWLAFTPQALFSTAELRRIITGIVPLYGLRGTRDYLVRLLQLCFEAIAEVHVDDRPRVGFTIGASLLGSDTRLAEGRAFFFRVVVVMKVAGSARLEHDIGKSFERRLRAVIDFAKPAHTVYELQVRQCAAAASSVTSPGDDELSF